MWDVVAVFARLQNVYFLIESRIREEVSNLVVVVFTPNQPVRLYEGELENKGKEVRCSSVHKGSRRVDCETASQRGTIVKSAE